MKIVIQCLYTQGWLDIARVVTPNIVSYCQKHGYSWNIKCISEPYDAFEKIREIQKLFSAGEADVVVSLDCDTVISNHLIKVEDIIDGDEMFFISRDYNNINAGVFIIKNCVWARLFLEALLYRIGKPEVYCEQDAIVDFMKDNEGALEEFKILPQYKINSYHYSLYKEIPPQTHEQGNFELGDWIAHFPGCSMETRLKLIQNTPIVQ